MGLLTALVLVSSAFVWAQDGAPPATDRARQFRHDLDLIRQLVRSGVDLSARQDPLDRARACNRLAGRLSEEIKQAATGSDGTRAGEMGKHFQAILEQGVASNLNLARNQLPAGASLNELKEVALQTAKLVKSAREELERLPQFDPKIQKITENVLRAGAQVENVLKAGGRVLAQPAAGKLPENAK
jgi:hypothetical protein